MCDVREQAAVKRSELSRAATFGGGRSEERGHNAWVHRLKDNMQHLKKLGVPVTETFAAAPAPATTGPSAAAVAGPPLNRRVSHLLHRFYLPRHTSHVTHCPLHLTYHSPIDRVLSPILPAPFSSSKAAATMIYEHRWRPILYFAANI
jgi:hypothetical protein